MHRRTDRAVLPEGATLFHSALTAEGRPRALRFSRENLPFLQRADEHRNRRHHQEDAEIDQEGDQTTAGANRAIRPAPAVSVVVLVKVSR